MLAEFISLGLLTVDGSPQQLRLPVSDVFFRRFLAEGELEHAKD